MTTNKEDNNNNIAPIARDSQSQKASPECCMCGDYGVSKELFQCRVCQFRTQHRYCSNLYPKDESSQVCNWCLSQKDDIDRLQISSNKTNSQEDDSEIKNKNNNRVVKSQRSNLQLQQQLNKPIKKQRSSPERSSPQQPTPTTRKRILSNGTLEEKKLLKRRKSSELEISNNNTVMIRKPVFRIKVRRYKLLDEVSS